MGADPTLATVLDRAACRAVLAAGRLGRVALTERALPMVVPAWYELAGESIRLAVNSPALERAADGRHVVCFQVDTTDADGAVRTVAAIGRLEPPEWSGGVAGRWFATLPEPTVSGFVCRPPTPD